MDDEKEVPEQQTQQTIEKNNGLVGKARIRF
jgi:hypothetical protein